MAVEIRLARHGRHKLPYYRIVVADRTKKRDGRYLELIGRYNTLTDPPAIDLNEERVRYWVGVGAMVSDTVRDIVAKRIPGFLETVEETRRAKLRAKRAKRKRNAKGAHPKKPKTT